MRRLAFLATLPLAASLLILAAPASAAPTVTGTVCATSSPSLCIYTAVLDHGAAVTSSDPAHARHMGFNGSPGTTHVIYFTAASGLCLRAPGSPSLNVIIGFTTGEAGVDFTWLNSSSGGHYFYNPHTGKYLSITNHGSVVTVESKGQSGWYQRFNGP
jgi:hypothetical protein